MSEKQTQPNLNLTPADLQNLIASAVSAAVAEARSQLLPLNEIAELKQSNATRAETAASVLAGMESKRFEQRTCTHQHSTGESHCVYVIDGNYILCQKCQGKIRPDDAKKADKSALYDTALFNRLFQQMSRSDM